LTGLTHDDSAASPFGKGEVLEGHEVDNLAYKCFETGKNAVPKYARRLVEYLPPLGPKVCRKLKQRDRGVQLVRRRRRVRVSPKSS
jgi:hypothetical protein